MEAVVSTKTLVPIYKTTTHHAPYDTVKTLTNLTAPTKTYKFTLGGDISKSKHVSDQSTGLLVERFFTNFLQNMTYQTLKLRPVSTETWLQDQQQ